MDAALFHPRERLREGFPEPAGHLELPAAQLGKALVHAEEVPREECGLVATRARAHLQNGPPLVGFVPRQQLLQQRLLQRRYLAAGLNNTGFQASSLLDGARAALCKGAADQSLRSDLTLEVTVLFHSGQAAHSKSSNQVQVHCCQLKLSCSTHAMLQRNFLKI